MLETQVNSAGIHWKPRLQLKADHKEKLFAYSHQSNFLNLPALCKPVMYLSLPEFTKRSFKVQEIWELATFHQQSFHKNWGGGKKQVKIIEVFPLTSVRPYLILSPLLQPLPNRAFTAAVFCLQQGWKRNSSSLKKLESNSVSVKFLGTPILVQIRFRIKLDAFQPTLLPGAKQWQRKFFISMCSYTSIYTSFGHLLWAVTFLSWLQFEGRKMSQYSRCCSNKVINGCIK